MCLKNLALLQISYPLKGIYDLYASSYNFLSGHTENIVVIGCLMKNMVHLAIQQYRTHSCSAT